MHPLDERDIRKSYAGRIQLLSRFWQDKYEGALNHSQKLMNLWISGYYQRGYSRWHLINLMNRGVSTIVSYLVEGNPRVMIEPLSPQLRTYAFDLKLILNHLIERENFADTVLIPGAVASMFGGVAARTFYEYDRRVSIDGEQIKVGTPRVSIIEAADYIGDPSAKRRTDFAFEGDIYRLPTDYAKDLFARHDRHGNQISDLITADSKLVTKYSTEELTSEQSIDSNKMSLDDQTTFIDVYNFKDRTIDTVMPMGKKAKVLRTIEWSGPGSPYSYLGYKFPPNSPVPIPPAWDWYDLDVTMNIMARAAREQAESQKDVIIAEPASKEAAEAILSARNMDVKLVKNVEGVKTFSLGGANRANFEWMNFAEEEFTKSGTASSDVMGGRGPTAPTLGQEQLVVENASRIVNNFYNRFQTWEEDILRKWSWAVTEDPTTYVEVLNTVSIPGVGEFEYPVFLTSADKAAEWHQLMLKVVTFSERRTNPEQKYNRLFQLMTSWILPTMQIRQAQGADIDLQQVDKLLAEFGGFDSFPQWYKSVVPQDVPEVNSIVKSSKSPGQQDDSLGASEVSRLANLGQQQRREGSGSDRKGPLDAGS